MGKTHTIHIREQVDAPKVSRQGGKVAIESDVSVAYTLEEGPNARWLVYVAPVTLSGGGKLRAKAVRLGYEDSEEVVVEATP